MDHLFLLAPVTPDFNTPFFSHFSSTLSNHSPRLVYSSKCQLREACSQSLSLWAAGIYYCHRAEPVHQAASPALLGTHHMERDASPLGFETSFSPTNLLIYLGVAYLEILVTRALTPFSPVFAVPPHLSLRLLLKIALSVLLACWSQKSISFTHLPSLISFLLRLILH